MAKQPQKRLDTEQLEQSEKQRRDYFRRQARLVADSPEGKAFLGFVAVKICNYFGPCATEEERIRRNVFCSIMNMLDLQDPDEMYRVWFKIAEHTPLNGVDAS